MSKIVKMLEQVPPGE